MGSEHYIPQLDPTLAAHYLMTARTNILVDRSDTSAGEKRQKVLPPQIDDYWVEQEVQFFKKKQADLEGDPNNMLDLAKGFSVCNVVRPKSVYMLCPETMHWRFQNRCPGQDIVSSLPGVEGVKIRRGFLRTYEANRDPYVKNDNNVYGLNFDGTHFLQLPPFYRSVECNTHKTSTVDEHETHRIQMLYDWTLEIWLKPQPDSSSATIFSISRSEGTLQYHLYIT
jgi:hypothetical protein